MKELLLAQESTYSMSRNYHNQIDELQIRHEMQSGNNGSSK